MGKARSRKLRSKIDVPADIAEEKLKALVLADEKVKSFLQGRPIRTIIIVPQKLANIVA